MKKILLNTRYWNVFEYRLALLKKHYDFYLKKVYVVAFKFTSNEMIQMSKKLNVSNLNYL